MAYFGLTVVTLAAAISGVSGEDFARRKDGDWAVLQGIGTDSATCALAYGGRGVGLVFNRTDTINPLVIEMVVLSKNIQFIAGNNYAFNLTIDTPGPNPIVFSGLLNGIAPFGLPPAGFWRAAIALRRVDLIDGMIKAAVDGGKLTVAFPDGVAGPLVAPLAGSALRALHWLDDCAAVAH